MAITEILVKDFPQDAEGRVAIVLSEFNVEISEGLLQGAESVFEQYPGLQWQVHRVPGAFEIPLMAQKLASMVSVDEQDTEERIFDVILALGCVIKGDTYHFELVANECARGCMEVMLNYDIPVVFEVLATYNQKDAEKRSKGKNNHGQLAASVAIDWLQKLKV